MILLISKYENTFKSNKNLATNLATNQCCFMAFFIVLFNLKTLVINAIFLTVDLNVAGSSPVAPAIFFA